MARPLNVLGLFGVAATGCVTAWLSTSDNLARLDLATIMATATRAISTAPGDAAPAPQRRTQDLNSQAKPVDDLPKFDVARLDAEGASVFAGRAAPNQRVTILIDGREFATTLADSDGNWAIAIERSIPPGRIELALVATGPEPGRSNRGQVVHVNVAASKVATAERKDRVAPPTARPVLPKAAELDPKAALKNFEAFVDRARAAAVEDPASLSAVQSSVPVPITFLMGKADMTADGGIAAQLLADYLRIIKPRSIALTGHADSRGADSYNMDLSLKRLVAIEQFLRASGYGGEQKLIPLGEHAPYRKIDRTKLTLDEIYQVDRRVELQVTR